MNEITPVPIWVRLADGVALCLLALAAWGSATGGGRTLLFGVVFSTAATGLWLYSAASILLVRHLVHRVPNTWQRLRALRARLAARPALDTALCACLVTRPAVLLVGVLALAIFGPQRPVGFTLSEDPVMNLPARFDAGWYGGIALEGYHWDHTFERQRNIAFFPAAPLLMRPLGAVFGMYERGVARERRMLRALWAGVAISLAAFFLGLYYLVRLGGDILGPERAPNAAWLLAAYPFSVFYSAPYTEALFLLGAVAAVFHFRKGEWTRSAIWGLLAGLSRPNGCFLSLPLAWMALRQVRAARPPARWMAPLAAAAAPGIGMLLFTVYLYWLTDVWFAWARSHAAWGRSFQGAAPLVNFVTALREQSMIELIMSSPYNTLNALGLVFACALVWPVCRRLGPEWGLFILANVVPPFLAGGVLSMGRLSSTLFPLFLVLAAMVPSRQLPAWLAVFGMGQGLCAVLFFTWRNLY